MSRFLVIGCGSIGQRHIRALLALGEKEIAAYRTGKGYCKELPKDITQNIKSFSSLEDAFKWEPTHLIISNPTSLHSEFIEYGLQNNCYLFIEKPIVNNFSDFRKIQNKYGVPEQMNGMVGYNLRFHGLFQEIKKIISSNNYGKIYYAYLYVGHYLPFWHPDEDYRESYAAKKELGGGVLRTLSHELDIAQYLFGKYIKSISRVDKVSELDIDVDDCFDMILESEECKRVVIHLDYLMPVMIRQGKILFEKGLLEYDYNKNKVWFTVYGNKEKHVIFNNAEDYNEQYIKQMTHFTRKDRSIACSIADGIEVIKLINECERTNT